MDSITKKMFFLFVSSWIFFPVYALNGEVGLITGKVLKEGQPIKGVFVSIKGDAGFERDVVSLEDGSYLFEDIPVGSYVLKVDPTGGTVRTEMIFVESNKQIDLGTRELFINRKTKTMSDFFISSSLDYIHDRNSLVFGKSSQYPGTINAVTKEFMEDVFSSTAIDVLVESTPGVSAESGYDTSFLIRGFRGATISINGVRVPRDRLIYFSPMPFNFASESIEVMKGASSFQGVPMPGGLVNYTLKRPHFDRFRGSINLSASSMDSKYGVYLDLSGPLDRKVENGKYTSSIAGRLNVALTQSTLENPNVNRTIFSTVSSIDIHRGIFSLQTDGVVTFSSGFLDRGVAVPNDRWVNNASDIALARPGKYDDYQKNIMAMANIVGKISLPEFSTDELRHKVDASLSYRLYVASEHLREHRVANRYFTDVEKKKTDLTKVATMHNSAFNEADSHQFNMEGIYELKQKNIKNKSKLGADISIARIPYTADFNQGIFLTPNIESVDKIGNPEQIIPKGKSLKDISNWSIKQMYHDLLGANDQYLPYNVDMGILIPKQNMPVEKGTDTTVSLGMYFLNQTEIYRWATILAGLRYDYVVDLKGVTKKKNFIQQGVSPVLGVVGHILKGRYGFKSFDLYAGATTGFEPLDPRVYWSSQESAGRSFQVDGGIRAQMKNGYYLSFSGYYLSEVNRTHGNPNFDKNLPVSSQNKPAIIFPFIDCLGTELEAKGEIFNGLYMGGVYSWCYKLGSTRQENQSIFEYDSSGALVKKVEGIDINSMPEHSGSVWIKYVLPVTPLRGVGMRISFSGFGQKKRPYDTAGGKIGDFLSPQYWANMVLSYSKKMFTAKLGFENLAGGRVWKSSFNAFRSWPKYDGLVVSASIGMKV